MLTKAFIECIKTTIRKGWTKGAYARGADDRELANIDPQAVKYCVMGAFAKCADFNINPAYSQMHREFYHVFEQIHKVAPVAYNDLVARDVEEVCRALDALPIGEAA